MSSLRRLVLAHALAHAHALALALALSLALAIAPTAARATPTPPTLPALPTIIPWDPATTWAVVAGVVRWRDPALEPFAARHRKDIELASALALRGVPDAQRTLLIDRGATADHVVAALDAQLAAAPPGATFILYLQGHGVLDDDGRFVFATADAHTDHLDRTGLDLARLLPLFLARDGRDRVLLLGDACYSGHLAALAAALTWLGIPAGALTSASDVSASSENWTFTQALIDGLAGRAIIDRDGDGRVLLSEVAAEARVAMRHREAQPIGWAPLALPDLDLGPAAPWPADIAALDPRGDTFVRGDWVIATRLDGERSVARVLGRERVAADDDAHATPSRPARKPRLRVEYYDYTDRAFAWTREDRADPVMFYTYPVGTRLQVEVDEVGYVAEVVRVEDGMHLVRFVERVAGTPPDEEPEPLPRPEFVTPDQIEGRVGGDPEADRVLVEDDGDLYEALVKGRFHDEVCVRYPGSPFTEDDCVPAARVSRDTREP